MEPEQMHQDTLNVGQSATLPHVFLSSSNSNDFACSKGDNSSNLGSKELLKQRLQYNKLEGSNTSMSPTKNEAHQGISGIEGSSTGAAGAADLGLKPSLLEEVLTDKKMALMRSPEVIRFLQTQQAKLMKEGKVPNITSNDKCEKS